jgi:ATP-dependent Lon protease
MFMDRSITTYAALWQHFISNMEGSFDNELQELMDGDDRKFNDDEVPEEVGILPIRNTVLFPGVIIPITVARDKSIQLVKEANATKNKIIGVLSQKKGNIENPETKDFFTVGTLAQILRLIRMPDGSVTIVIQGRSRFEVQGWVQEKPYFKARIARKPEEHPGNDESRALMLSLKQEAARIIELSPKIPSEANITLQNISSLSFLVHFIASNLNLDVTDKQAILEKSSLMEKGQEVLQNMKRELQVLELSEEIQNKVKTDLDKQQRDYILRQQIKAIQDELGDEGSEADAKEMDKRAAKKKWPKAAQEAFEKEKAKLQRINQASPEYSVVMNYLEWMLDLPWEDYTKDNFDLARARKVLADDHYGLEKVKDRILEHLAVLKLKKDMKAPILCFYGPPGVGKTSLGKSIAKALGRNFVRMSLGGVHDEAEIRGHRRTYIGSMPGRVLQGLKKAKTGNPVMMLDEIDKVGNDFRGDPASALLEVLDPEQNNAFNDHYLELDYNLQPVMFIATANTLDTIHPALRDRMEIIEINGYTLPEKLHIARAHLLPKTLHEHGLKANQLKLDDEVLAHIIDGYTRESGVRKLSQRLASVARGVAREIVEGKKKNARVAVTKKDVRKYLGPVRHENEEYQKLETPGVSVGLAWTAVGGEILFIETALSKGTGRLSLTGQLGEVMKESAHVAYIYLKAHAEQYGIDPDVFKHWDVHLHIPAGAIPKDGPSAGITMLTAMASAFSQRQVKPRLAMTGEITLRGKVLPVGGIKEKLLAAVRAGMKEVLLSKENKKDVDELKPDMLAGLKITYVATMDDVLELALEKKKAKNALQLKLPANGKSHSNAPHPTTDYAPGVMVVN